MTKRPFILGCDEMSRLVPKLMEIIPTGRANAVTGRELATRFGMSDDRKIRVAIRDLIARGVPVASSVSEPCGYYKCAHEFEAASYLKNLEAMVKEDQARIRDFRTACEKSNFELPVQGDLFGAMV